jgi:cytochrome b561
MFEKFRTNNIFKQLMSLHWWMAICYLLLFHTGEMISKSQGGFGDRELTLELHKSFGVLALLLLGWRVCILLKVWGRKYHKHLPKLTGNWYFRTCLHTVLYLLMFAVPLSGYWLVNVDRANNISLFGLPMPDVFSVNGDVVAQASAAHSQTSRAFKILIVIHIVAQYKFVRANWRRLSAWIVKFRGKG